MKYELKVILAFLVPVILTVNGQKATKDQCVDLKSNVKCNFWKRHGSCRSHEHRMMKYCPKTCNLCGSRDACQRVSCQYPKYCKLDSNGKPFCACSLECKMKSVKKRLGAVCGTDGRSYINICKMQFTACEQGRSISVRNFGQCDIEKCEDKQAKALCLGWQKAGACKVYIPLMKRYCSKTCGLCPKRAAAPETDCRNTVYGCCPDNTTRAIGPNGRGCPGECKDKYDFCRRFTIDCVSKLPSNRKFMKKHCPLSCGYCTRGTR